MRVTYLLSDLGGGTGHHLFDLLAMREEGSWQADIVSEVPSTSRMELPVDHRVLDPPPGPARYPIRQVQRYRQIERVIGENPPDLLHTYHFWSILYGRLLKARGVVSRLVESREDTGFAWGAHEYALLALTRHLPDRVVCVAGAVRDIVVQREGLPESRIEVIRNGVGPFESDRDPELPDLRRELGIQTDIPVVVMVANYDRPIKGVGYFLESIPLIRTEIPSARFVLVGTGRREGELRARAQQLGIEDVLLMPGFRDDVHRFYALADVSVLTSLSEGLSITILESMRHGVPVVATHVGGNPELVQNGITGLLVPPGDVERFAAAVVRLLRDRRLRMNMGSRARSRALREFALDRVVGRYADLYEEVCRDSHGPP